MADEHPSDWITTELRRAAATERAPSHLRLQIDALSRVQNRHPGRRLVLVPVVGVLAAIVVALLLVLPGGTPGGPTVAQAAALGAQPVSWSPPADGASVSSLTGVYARFADVRFPGALQGNRWTFQTWRIARLGGHRILTVYYSRGDVAVSYSVAASPELSGQKPGFSSFRLDGRSVVSWQESHHSCLLSSANASPGTLLALARS